MRWTLPSQSEEGQMRAKRFDQVYSVAFSIVSDTTEPSAADLRQAFARRYAELLRVPDEEFLEVVGMPDETVEIIVTTDPPVRPVLACAPGFTLFSDDDDYTDWDHYPEGFHTRDRGERITQVVETGTWYATIVDKDDDGVEYHEATSQENMRTPEQAYAWILARRAEGEFSRPPGREGECVCKTCHESRRVEPDAVPCPDCTSEALLARGYFMRESRHCRTCDGQGMVIPKRA